MALDWRNRADIAIIIAATAAAILSDTIIPGGAIITVGSVIRVPVIGVPVVISVVVFIR
jgi:hypothetical protein